MVFVGSLIDLCVTNQPFAELPAVFGCLGADPKDRDVILLVSTVLINKGRNLGPAPRSPLAAVKKHDRGRRLLQYRWKCNRSIVDILQGLRGKCCPNLQKCHNTSQTIRMSPSKDAYLIFDAGYVSRVVS